jgi:hypothetical protein
MTTSREAFEKWCEQENISTMEVRWEVWQASRAALIAEIKATCKAGELPEGHPFYRLPDTMTRHEGEV